MRERLVPFLRKAILSSRRDGSECREIVLQHASAGSKTGSAVQTWEIESLHQKDSAIESLATEIEAIAQSDASGFGGTQTYVVKAFHGEGDRSSSRLTFRADGDCEDDDVSSSEPTNSKGLLAQTMRHNEIIMKASMVSIAATMQTLQRTVVRQAERLEKMEDDRLKNLAVYEQLMSSSHDRELEAKKEERRGLMATEMLKELKLLAPVVVNKIAGKQLMPAPVKEVLGAFFSSLKPEQAATIYGSLDEGQRALLTEFQSIVSTENE